MYFCPSLEFLQFSWRKRVWIVWEVPFRFITILYLGLEGTPQASLSFVTSLRSRQRPRAAYARYAAAVKTMDWETRYEPISVFLCLLSSPFLASLPSGYPNVEIHEHSGSEIVFSFLHFSIMKTPAVVGESRLLNSKNESKFKIMSI